MHCWHFGTTIPTTSILVAYSYCRLLGVIPIIIKYYRMIFTPFMVQRLGTPQRRLHKATTFPPGGTGGQIPHHVDNNNPLILFRCLHAKAAEPNHITVVRQHS